MAVQSKIEPKRQCSVLARGLEYRVCRNVEGILKEEDFTMLMELT